MTYTEFKQVIGSTLRKHSRGMTWNQLKTTLELPYARPCPEWTKRLEKEISLVRRKGTDRALVWTLGNKKAAKK